MSTTYAIFDTSIGLVQYIGAATTPRAALAAFDADVGIDPAGIGLDAVAESFRAVALTADAEQALRAWMDAGSPAAECPVHPRDMVAT